MSRVDIDVRFYYEFEGPDVETLDSTLLMAYLFAAGGVRSALFGPSEPTNTYTSISNVPSANGGTMNELFDDPDGAGDTLKGRRAWIGQCLERIETNIITRTTGQAQGAMLALKINDAGEPKLYFALVYKTADSRIPPILSNDYENAFRFVSDVIDDQGRLVYESSVLRDDGTLSVKGRLFFQLWRVHFKVVNAEADVVFRDANENLAPGKVFYEETISGGRTVIVKRCTGVFLNIAARPTGSSAAAIVVYRNGTRIAIGSNRVTLNAVSFSDGTVFEIRAVSTKEIYAPLFADIEDKTSFPVFCDMVKRTFRPLYASLGVYFISYAFLDKSHLWTRITTYNSNLAEAVPDECFVGRESLFDGSSGERGENIRPVFPKLVEFGYGGSPIKVTLYFFCALCNWGCTSDYETGDVDFTVLWKSFSVHNIPRATSSNPGPGNETFAFSATFYIKRSGSRYWPVNVTITDKDGNTY